MAWGERGESRAAGGLREVWARWEGMLSGMTAVARAEVNCWSWVGGK